MKSIHLSLFAFALLCGIAVNAQTSSLKSTSTTSVKSTSTAKATSTAKTGTTKAKTTTKRKVAKPATTSVNTSKLAVAADKPAATTPSKTSTTTVVSPNQLSSKVVPVTSPSATPRNNLAAGANTTPVTGANNAGNGGNTGTNNGSSTTNSPAGNIFDQLTGGATTNTTTSNITQLDAASAIKDALSKGITTGVNKVSVTDGYFGNSLIKIPFPQDVQIVESTLRSFGMGSMIDNLVLSLNRAAENAAVQAGPIFLNSIKQMTITDALNIVGNQQPDAATQFLQRTTTESLVGAFKPSIKTALDNTLATKYWTDITSYYNKIPFVSPVNSDLPDYVTRKATTGLFLMIAQEEAKIRKDPVGTGSAIVDKVFGAFKK